MKYLVPYDFTPIAYTALQHALQLALTDPGKIELLHIIESGEEKEPAEAKFKQLSEELDEQNRKQITSRIRIGSIFKDISSEAKERDADLIVMGTHGTKGLQWLFGSHAIKVITSSSIPFLITQNKEPEGNIDTVVLPVDLSHENIQIAGFAGQLAHKYNAEVHIVAKAQRDEFLKKRLGNNIVKVRRLLKREGVNFRVEMLEGEHSFHHEVMQYGNNNGADMYAIAHHPQTLIPQLEKFSQELITNEYGTPVLIVNAKEHVGVKSNYAFIGI